MTGSMLKCFGKGGTCHNDQTRHVSLVTVVSYAVGALVLSQGQANIESPGCQARQSDKGSGQ